jgi:N-acetylglucosaminyl-diphospho-decaprenol L-rhamnosyltransferase
MHSHPGNTDEAYEVAVVIVGFRNCGDIRDCVSALATQVAAPPLRVFIAENGGSEAFDALVAALLGDPRVGPIRTEGRCEDNSLPGRRRVLLGLTPGPHLPSIEIHIAEMDDNVGYGGGVNAWLRPLLAMPAWRRVWILNPDTQPSPTALTELVAYSKASQKGLVGSRVTLLSRPDCIQTRGMSWSKLRAGVVAIDGYTAAKPPRDNKLLLKRLDAPTGASMFADRELVARIGLMAEHYFLYGEDLEWGLRAKRIGAVGYADDSVVLHKGGSTIGTARRRRDKSALSVYLYARNRILFVREHYPSWMAWTVLVSLAHLLTFAAVGALTNFGVAWRGFRAGLAGETGRPSL